MKNSEKADSFFYVAMEHLNLFRSDASHWQLDQVNPVVEPTLEQLGRHAINSPYICDTFSELYISLDEKLALHEEMRKAGMNEIGFAVWSHVEAERRQEARWFFLMFLVEFLDNEID